MVWVESSVEAGSVDPHGPQNNTLSTHLSDSMKEELQDEAMHTLSTHLSDSMKEELQEGVTQTHFVHPLVQVESVTEEITTSHKGQKRHPAFLPLKVKGMAEVGATPCR